MFCNQCGNTMPEDAMFCPVCGAKKDAVATVIATPANVAVSEAAPAVMPTAEAAPATAVQQNRKPKKPFPIKWILVAVAAVVLLAGVLTAVLLLTGGLGYDFYAEDRLSYDYESRAFYIASQKDKVYVCEEEYVDTFCFNGDGSCAVYMAYTEDANGGMQLYYIDEAMEPKLIAEDVYACDISYTGEYIAYVQDAADYVAGDLYLYCVKTGDMTQIDKKVYPYTITLSPNGKVVCYLRDYESYDENELYMGGINKDSVEIDDDGCKAIAVTDDGKHLYYMNANNKLYHYYKKDSEKVASDIDGYCWVNKDSTEILFAKEGKTYYHTVKMDEPVKIYGDTLYEVMVPGNVAVSNSDITVVGVDSFKGAMVKGYNDIFRINDKGTEGEKLCYSYYDSQLSKDGNAFLYVDGGILYKIKDLRGGAEPEVLCNDMYVEDFAASDDLSKIYVAAEEELYYLKGANKAVEITNDLAYGVYGGYAMAYNNAMDKIFFVEDDTLCYAGTNEKSKKDVEEDIYDVYEYGEGIMYTIEDEEDYTYTYYYMDSKEVIEMDFD